MVAATFRSFVGVGKETTPGTGVVPTHYIPVTEISSMDDLSYLHDEGMRGSMVTSYGVQPGPKHGEVELKGNVDLTTIGFLLSSVLGDVATTGAGAPFTHTFAVKNTTDGQPTSMSFSDFNGVETRRYVGAKTEELSFKFTNDGLFEYESKIKSYASAIVSDPTPAYSTYTPIANWKACVTIGGVANLLVQEGEFTISRDVDTLHTLNCGDNNPYKLFSGAVTVEGKLTFIYESNAELLRYLNNSQPALNILWEHTAATDSLNLHSTKAAYTAAEVKRGEQYAQLEVEFYSVANSTDAGASGGLSPVKATLLNTVAASVYA